MPEYIITVKDRYLVEANSLEQALASYRILFDGIEPEIFDLKPNEILDQDAFEYYDGHTTAEEN